MEEIMQEHDKSFREKINQFINSFQNNDDNIKIKLEYIKLVKEFHPDVNKSVENKLANEYMVIINYIYEQLINKKKIVLKLTDEYEKNKVDKKYCFINEEGIEEYLSDKTVYIYKLGKYEYDRAVCKSMKPIEGDIEKEGYEIIGHLYKAYKYFKEVIKIDRDGMWGKAAEENLNKAYEMNRRITRGLNKSDKKELIKTI
jgi:curved DNA-binding protein CbpA